MAVNVTPLEFDEGGNNIIIDTVTGPQYTATTKIDFQVGGIMLENVDTPVSHLVFIPWANVKQITQDE